MLYLQYRTLGHEELDCILKYMDTLTVRRVCKYWRFLSERGVGTGRDAPCYDYVDPIRTRVNYKTIDDESPQMENSVTPNNSVSSLPNIQQSQRMLVNEVHVTGFSGRFPSSESVKDFWNKLCAGQVVCLSSSEVSNRNCNIHMLRT